MTKLSLNKASKEAGVAKTTLSDALKSGRMSAEKNERGRWEIDPAELFRVFPKTSSTEQAEPKPNPQENHEKPQSDSGLAVEVKMLREQIDRMDKDREQERAQMTDQIENLRGQIERQSADHRQALAAITDQRDKPSERRGWFSFGRKAG